MRLVRQAVECQDGLRLLDVRSDARAGRAQRAAVAAAAPYARLWGRPVPGKAVLFVRAIAQRALHAPGSSHAMFRLRAAATGAAMAAVP